MGHHGGHHLQGHDYKEEQQYGAHPGSNFGSYKESTSYAPPPLPSYRYQQQPLGYGDYGSVPSVPYGAVQPYGGYGYLQASYGPGAQFSLTHRRAKWNILWLMSRDTGPTSTRVKQELLEWGLCFAAYEHWMEEKMAEVIAVGAGGSALYVHQQARHEREKNWKDSRVEKERLAEINMTDAPRHRTNERKGRAGAFEIDMTKVVSRRKEWRSVKLSTDPYSVAARKRRNKKNDRNQILRILVPDCNDESEVPIPLLYDRTRSFVLRLLTLLQTQFNV